MPCISIGVHAAVLDDRQLRWTDALCG